MTRRRTTRRWRERAAWGSAAVLALSVAFTGGLLAAPVDLTPPAPPRPAVLLDAHGRPFAAIDPPETREDVPLAAMPAVLRQAFIAAEDRTFFSHRGVDPFAVARALFRDLTGGRTQGGSTITEQYVKNTYVGHERTPARKVREAAVAVRLERRLAKQEILARYLNAVYLGNGTYGVQAASRFYFGVPVTDLDLEPTTRRRSPTLALARAALLAGVVPAPSRWNPVRDERAARSRQRYVLEQMVGTGFAAPQTAALAFGRALPPVVGRNPDRAATDAPEFRDLVERELRRRYDDDVLFRGGLAVRTSLDLDLQRAVVAAIREQLPAPDDPQAAVVAVDPRTGDVRAMATRVVTDSTRGYRRGGLNLTTDAARPSGSTIKPFTLAAALAQGKTVDDRYHAPRCASIPNPGGTPDPWRPCNAERSERGTYTLREAMEDSVNTVYAPLADEVGVANVRAVALSAGWAPAARFGTNKSAALGVDVTPIALTRAYATLVNDGVRQDLRSILEVRAAGRPVALAPPAPAGVQAVRQDIAAAVADVLAGVVERGTGTAARQPFPVYGKTGTTNDFTNAWFVGCTRELCLGVWMGYDRQYLPTGEPHAMRHVEGVRVVYGGTLPARIFARTWEAYRGGVPR